MLRFVFLWIALQYVVAQEQPIGQFFNPPIATIEQPNFDSNPVWILGETQLVQWTTIYSSYSIAIWQQALSGGSAQEGPSIFQTEKGAVTQFNWVVQSFEFDMKRSNVFFLWLISPGIEASSTSHYFNISAQGSSTSTSSSQPSSITSASSTTIATDTEPATSPSSTTLPETKESSKPANGLSIGPKIALGLGIPMGLAIIAVAIFVVFRNIKTGKTTKHDQSPPQYRPDPCPPVKEGPPVVPQKNTVEIGDGYVLPAELS